MKSIFSFLLIFVYGFCNAQVKSQGGIDGAGTATNSFFDANGYSDSGWGTSFGKGLNFPQADLTQFTFNVDDLTNAVVQSGFDGMVVYNTTTGLTVADASVGGVQVSVSPGFYYFSNPNSGDFSLTDVTNGRWLPLGGGSSVKSKTVTGVVADGIAATLNLGTAVIAANEVVELVGAKVYNAAGDLVIGAFSDYTKATNILATGNGAMYQVLPAGTYKVVVDYR